MREDVNQEMSEPAVWILVVVVFLSLSAVLMIVFNNEKTKPQSPHALVATAFNQYAAKAPTTGALQMPTVNPRIELQQPVWQPLPVRGDRIGIPKKFGQQGRSDAPGLVFQKIIR